MSIDPVTTDANTGSSFNRYVYANNSPFSFVDPDGREARGIDINCTAGCETWGSLHSNSDREMVNQTSFQYHAETMGMAIEEVADWYSIGLGLAFPEVGLARAAVAKFALKEIPKLLPPKVANMTLGEAGGVIGWGKGPTDAVMRNASMTSSKVNKKKNSGINRDAAVEFRGFYKSEYIRNPNNLPAKYRVKLMETILGIMDKL